MPKCLSKKFFRLFAFLGFVFLGLPACSPDSEQVVEEAYDPAHDYFTFANYRQFTTRHLELDLTVDFEAEQLRGSATLFMTRLDPGASTVILDTRDIDVQKTAFSMPDGSLADAEFRLDAKHPMLGQALEIDLPEDFEPAEEFKLEITYRTHPAATALQWLGPELTAGGQHPFMFSQSQSIHARSWIPMQDTPAVRITYTATIHTPEDLLALMSADNDPLAPRSGEYHFEMPQPIPSYLMAIAVGNIYFAPIGAQTGVYSEPELLSASAWEFGGTQEMLERVEEKYGPYQWGRYDLLILPPSFPFGGMENPRLSFITPSVLAGDRSLVSLIAHELAHSWSGNLVTNKTWRDIWLNEGITSYLDARVMEMLFGKERADEERYLGYRDLLEQFSYISPQMQALAPDLRDADPDVSQGSVHYAKGQMLLEQLEKLFGREQFDRFLIGYFAHFQWQSISTEQFLDYLDQHLLQADPGKFSREQVGEWLYQPGLPADAPIPHSESFDRSSAVARAWMAGELRADDIPIDEWSPHAVVNLINSLPADVSNEQLSELDAALGLGDTRNAVIARAWFVLVAKRRHTPSYAQLEQHLNRYGRTWLIRDVYRALVENEQDGELANAMFVKALSAYHPLTIKAIERVLKEK